MGYQDWAVRRSSVNREACSLATEVSSLRQFSGFISTSPRRPPAGSPIYQPISFTVYHFSIWENQKEPIRWNDLVPAKIKNYLPSINWGEAWICRSKNPKYVWELVRRTRTCMYITCRQLQNIKNVHTRTLFGVNREPRILTQQIKHRRASIAKTLEDETGLVGL